METNPLSASSIGDEKLNEGASGMKSESDESTIHRIQILDETGRSVEVSQESSITVQNESWKAQKNRSSVCTIDKDSSSNNSFRVGDENLKASGSMLSSSFTSTTAICGSSTSDIASSEEEPLDDLENVGEKRGTNNIDQSNNQPCEETDNTGVTMGSRSKVYNESMKVQEDLSSICSIGKDTESDTSLKAYNGKLKTSESMLSFISTAATCGSSTSDIASSEEEPMGDLQDISGNCETQHDSNLENPISELTPRAENDISNHPSSIFYSGTNLGDESQTDCECTSAKESLLAEDSTLLKSTDLNNSLDDTSQQLYERKLSEDIKTDEFPLKMPLSSTLKCFSRREEPPSDNNPITVPPLVRMASSLNTRRIEPLPDGRVTLRVNINGLRGAYWHFEDKSFRRTRVPTLGEVASSFLAPSIADPSRKIGPLFAQAPKSLQQTSPEEGDWDLYEKSGRSTENESSTVTGCPSSSESDVL